MYSVSVRRPQSYGPPPSPRNGHNHNREADLRAGIEHWAGEVRRHLRYARLAERKAQLTSSAALAGRSARACWRIALELEQVLAPASGLEEPA